MISKLRSKSLKDRNVELSVIIPTMNEAANIPLLVESLQKYLEPYQAEIIFVDDSSDETPQIITALRKGNKSKLQIELFRREPEKRTGLGSAVAEGIKLAKGKSIAVMDGDLQHPPELLAEMYKRLEKGDVDMVVASRYREGGSSRGLAGPMRHVVSVGSKVVAQALFGEARKTTDPLSGFFMCKSSVLKGIEFRPVGFKILLEILVCARTLRVVDVPCIMNTRYAGTSNASVKQGIAYLNHLYSLLTQVPNSAREWKYAIVGGLGLGIYLTTLEISLLLHLNPYAGWGIALLISLLFNWNLNQVFTFADIASPFSHGRSRYIYLPAAMVGGVINFAIFFIFLNSLQILGAGVLGAIGAMGFNYWFNRKILHRSPMVMNTFIEMEKQLINGLENISKNSKVELLIRDGSEIAGLPSRVGVTWSNLIEKPILLAEAPSLQPQPRKNIGFTSWMLIPLPQFEKKALITLSRVGKEYTREELEEVLIL